MTKELTEKRRHSLSALVLVVGLSVLPTSLWLMAVAAYILFIVDEEVKLVRGVEPLSLPCLLAVTGLLNCLSSWLLLSVMARVYRPSLRAHALKTLIVSIVFSLLSTVLVLVTCVFCFIQMKQLPTAFQEGLVSAMQQYAEVPDVKQRVDMLQMEYECCGDSGYSDWFKIPWVPEDILMVPPEELALLQRDGWEYVNDDVPFSCCDPSSPRPCIHHHVTTPHLHYNYDIHINSTLHRSGCRWALIHFYHGLLLSSALSLLFLFLAQLAMLAVCRVVQTSMQTACQAGHMTDPAKGYLFKKPKPKEKPEDDGQAEKWALLTASEDEWDEDLYPDHQTNGEPNYSPGQDHRPSASNAEPVTAGMLEEDELEEEEDWYDEGEPVYENVPPGKLYGDALPEGVLAPPGLHIPPPENFYDEVAGGSAMEVGPGPPLGRSSGRAANTAQNNSVPLELGRRRSSKAFDSLGISPLLAPPPPPPPPPAPSFPAAPPPPPPPLPPPAAAPHSDRRQ